MNDLQVADSAAICISRKMLLVRIPSRPCMRSVAHLATENRLLIGHLCATPLFATAQVVHFPILTVLLLTGGLQDSDGLTVIPGPFYTVI